MKLRLTLIAMVFMAFSSFAQSNLTTFLTYSIPNQVTTTIGNGQIEVLMPQGTDLSELVPSFTLSAGAAATIGGIAQVSGTTVVDFSSGSKTYKVTAEDGVTTQDWVVSVSVETGVETVSFMNVQMYPNPATDYVTIENAEGATVVVYNILGSVVSTSVSNNSNYQLNLTNLPKGSYIVRVQKGAQQITKKLTIVK